MISCDTNILLHSLNTQSPFHEPAKAFLRARDEDRSFALCELVLIELYVLLRNPAVLSKPLSSQKAVDVCRRYRQNRYWAIVDYPGGLMNMVWEYASNSDTARRAIFDARLAYTLLHHNVTDFATGNVKHFQEYDFHRVWNPLASENSGH